MKQRFRFGGVDVDAKGDSGHGTAVAEDVGTVGGPLPALEGVVVGPQHVGQDMLVEFYELGQDVVFLVAVGVPQIVPGEEEGLGK